MHGFSAENRGWFRLLWRNDCIFADVLRHAFLWKYAPYATILSHGEQNFRRLAQELFFSVSSVSLFILQMLQINRIESASTTWAISCSFRAFSLLLMQKLEANDTPIYRVNERLIILHHMHFIVNTYNSIYFYCKIHSWPWLTHFGRKNCMVDKKLYIFNPNIYILLSIIQFLQPKLI